MWVIVIKRNVNVAVSYQKGWDKAIKTLDEEKELQK